MARIFLSYASENKPQVDEIYDRLQALGFEPWMDKRDLLPGQAWQREISRALKASELVLVCLSQHTSKAGYVQREFRLVADALQEMPENIIHTIPVRLEVCELPEQFAFLETCDVFEPNGFDRLVQAMRYALKQRHETVQTPEESSPVTMRRSHHECSAREEDAQSDDPSGVRQQSRDRRGDYRQKRSLAGAAVPRTRRLTVLLLSMVAIVFVIVGFLSWHQRPPLNSNVPDPRFWRDLTIESWYENERWYGTKSEKN